MNTNITQLLDLIAQIAPNKYLHYSGFRRAGRGDPHRYPQAVFECVNLDKAINFKEFFYYSAVDNEFYFTLILVTCISMNMLSCVIKLAEII